MNNYDETISRIILEEHINTKEVYGVLRLKHHIQNKYGLVLNHKLIRRYKNELNLITKARRKRSLFIREQRKRTYELAVPNLLNNNFHSINRLTKLSTDVSYITCTDGRLYLSAVKDLFNNQIISYEISNRNDLRLILNTLNKLKPGCGIIHSDQGTVYLTKTYQNKMKSLGYKVSMSRRGACWENSPIENWFSQLKEEHLRNIGLKTKEQTKTEIKKYIDWYNNQRIQKALGYLPPVHYN